MPSTEHPLSMIGWRAGSRKAAIVGDTLILQPPQPFTPTVVLTTRPGGSAAAMSGTSCTLDVSGLYVFTVSAGAFSVVFEAVCFPASALTTTRVATAKQTGARADVDKRLLLQAIANHPSCTAASVASLTTNSPLPTWLVNFAEVGGDQ